MLLYPEITHQFYSVHQCQSGGRSCQNRFVGIDFEAQLWPTRKESFEDILMGAMGQGQHAPHVSTLRVEGRMVARRRAGRRLPG